MTTQIFIDGEHGTTGLQIINRLEKRDDVAIVSLPHEERRNIEARKACLQQADIAILCLPDETARESVALAGEADTRFIDASSAHRIHPDWVFGFKEMTVGQAEKIAKAKYVSNPGCYSTGAIALVNPLVEAGVMAPDYPLSINAVSGYTGGGKGLIAQMENTDQDDHITSNYFSYALGLQQKHVPEIIKHCGLEIRPIFTPGVGRFAQGMLVQVPLFCDLLSTGSTPQSVADCLISHYADFDGIQVIAPDQTKQRARIIAEELVGTNEMRLYVQCDDKGGQINLVAQLDNLGKGSSGAAVQNLDLMMGTLSR